MLLIDEKQVQETITMPMVFPVIQKAYEDCEKGAIYVGGRIFMPVRGEENTGQWLVANCTSAPYFGSKYSVTFPGNLAKGLPSGISKISLYSAETGELLALIDANYLTGLKTAGSAAIATDLMARKQAEHLGVIGTGLQAVFQVMAIQEIRELTEVRVFDLSDERMDAFIEKIRAIQNRPYAIIKSASSDDCVANSDILCTCTPSQTPVFSGKAVRPGTHINAIGSFTPFMQEIDEETVLKADKIITEHVSGLWEAAGDILIPLEKGLITREKVSGSVGEVLTGKIPGREDEDEITLYESVGSGVLDLALAIAVYKQQKEY